AGHELWTFEIAVSSDFPAEIAAAFDLSASVAAHVRDLRRDGWFPLALSCNCNMAVAAASGCGCRRTAVVWFDAHGEPTTPEAVTNRWSPPGGLTVDVLADSVAAIRRRMPLKGAGIGSYDPAADGDGRGARAAGRVIEALVA